MSTLRETRHVLVDLVVQADDRTTQAAIAKDKIKKLINSLSGGDIASLVRDIRSDLLQNQEAIETHEKRAAELRAQLEIIQEHCSHSSVESDSEGNMEILTCKICGRSRTLDYSASRFYR